MRMLCGTNFFFSHASLHIMVFQILNCEIPDSKTQSDWPRAIHKRKKRKKKRAIFSNWPMRTSLGGCDRVEHKNFFCSSGSRFTQWHNIKPLNRVTSDLIGWVPCSDTAPFFVFPCLTVVACAQPRCCCRKQQRQTCSP